MAQSGYTPIQLYNSSTPSAAPTAGNLAAGELAINTYDGVLYYKDSAGVVRTLASKSSSAGIFTSVTDSGLTSGRVTYAGVGGLLQDSTNLTFDGTTLTAAGLAGPHNGTVGATTPSTGAFTTLSASSTVSGTGFSTYLASPPAIGATAANTGAFTTLSASSTVSGTGFSTYLASPPAIGGTTAAAITGTTITANTGFAGALNGTVGATTPNTGAFTTLSASSTVTLSGGTANGVLYLNGSKAATSGSALTFDGSILQNSNSIVTGRSGGADGSFVLKRSSDGLTVGNLTIDTTNALLNLNTAYSIQTFSVEGNERMRLTTTGLGIGGTTNLTGSRLYVQQTGELYTGGASSYNSLFPSGYIQVLESRNVPSGTVNSSLLVFSNTNSNGNTQAYIGSQSGNSDNGPAYLVFGQKTSSTVWTERGRFSTDGTFRVKGAGTAGSTDAFQVSGSAPASAFLLDSAGNAGLGVTPYGWAGGYKAIDNLIYNSSYSNNGGLAGMAFNAYNNGTNWIYKITTNANRFESTLDSFRWYTAPSGTAGDVITFTQAMTLSADGTFRVKGAGTAGSTDAFQVSGSAPASAVSVGSNGDMTINGLTVGKGAGSVSGNAVLGFQAGYSNTTGSNNISIGSYANYGTTNTNNNIAIGYNTISQGAGASNNVVVGNEAQRYVASSVVAVGHQALTSSTANNNTAVGYQAGYSTTAGSNTFLGYQAGYVNSTGTLNTFIGSQAGGLSAGVTGQRNVGVGDKALGDLTSGNNNIGIGFTDSVNGYAPVFDPTTESNRIILGTVGITNAYVKVAWTVTSDARDKTNILDITHGLAFVQQLKPKSYQFKTNRNDETPSGNVRYGFLAQDILALEGSNPVIIDNEDADHLKYQGESLVPILVKAIQELKAELDTLKSQLGK